MSGPIPRTGGRLLLVDADDRLLLIHERLEFTGSHWLTPGGGVEAGERPVDAAIREAAEEIGYDASLAADEVPALVTRRLWSFHGVSYDQTDHFYLARVPVAFDPAPRGLTELERSTLLGYRWWTLDELRATDQTLLPEDLAAVLATVLGAAAAGA